MAPAAVRLGHQCDIDHVVRREHDGTTSLENLELLCRTDHQMKDDGYMQVRSHADGSTTWNTRWGTEWTSRPAIRLAPPPGDDPPGAHPPGDDPPGDDPAPF